MTPKTKLKLKPIREQYRNNFHMRFRAHHGTEVLLVIAVNNLFMASYIVLLELHLTLSINHINKVNWNWTDLSQGHAMS